MKTAILNRSFYYIAYLLLATIFIASIAFSSSQILTEHPEISTAFTFDLTLTAPLLYLFIIWKTKIPKTTVVPFLLVSIFIASYLIPEDQQKLLSLIKTSVVPFAEIVVLSFLAWKVYKTAKAYKSTKNEKSDILNVLLEVSKTVFPVRFVANLLAFELAVIYYAFFSWRRAKSSNNSFTYHKNSGKLVLFAIIIFIVLAETIVIHILLENWSPIIAWILSLSSLYVVLQIFAHMKAVYQRPIEVIGNKLFIRYGLFKGTEIYLEDIESAEVTSIRPTDSLCVKQVSLLGEIEQFNIKIQVKNQAIFSGFYGKEEKFKTLLLFVDETEKFKKTIKLNESK